MQDSQLVNSYLHGHDTNLEDRLPIASIAQRRLLHILRVAEGVNKLDRATRFEGRSVVLDRRAALLLLATVTDATSQHAGQVDRK